MRKRILSVVGARPNYMKVAPLHRALAAYGERVEHMLVHTGQHYDAELSDIFFEELRLPPPVHFLGVGSGTHAEQTARVMLAFEPVCMELHPDLVVVVGDVNSTLACALTAVKLGIPLAHVEAGLRSFDRTMPEEINRVVTDAVADYLFATEPSAVENLRREGVPQERIFLVGNTMIDSLQSVLPAARAHPIREQLGLRPRSYAVVTLHRPSNVDVAQQLGFLLEALRQLAQWRCVVFPMHPRTRTAVQRFGLEPLLTHENIRVLPPLGYVEFLALVGGGGFRDDRFRRNPGGVHLRGDSVPDTADHNGASNHVPGGHKPFGAAGAGAAVCSAGAAPLRVSQTGHSPTAMGWACGRTHCADSCAAVSVARSWGALRQ
jgi:UDP-N-acetylglucosamine 2-epimerase (non-hydrolysing)